MEDPWSTPWAVETPSASPGLPPTKPKTVARLPGTGTITPSEGGVLDIGGAAFDNSPWGGATTTTNGGFDATQQDEDEDKDEVAWGRWDDGKHNAWGTGHNGDASIDASKEPSGGFSAPWGLVGEELSAGLEGVTDSAVSLGEQAREEAKPVPVVAVQDDTRKKATALLEDEQDAWTAPQDHVVAPSQAIADSPTPDKEPPHPAEDSKVVEQAALEEYKAEDAPSDAQTQQQKASKVQELVDMYDGIAKKAVRPPADMISRESSASGSAEASREDLTRQDSIVEDGLHLEVTMERKPVEEDEYTTAGRHSGAPRTEDLGVANEISTLNDDTIKEETSSTTAQDTKSDEKDIPRLVKAEQQSDTTKPNTKHPPYPIDLSNLEALFPGSTPSTANPEPVPDFIIDNSYTTTSERRTWYRISRFGSTRKHDSGDDEDNYKRITWGASEVRTKTLHIVRRWMEQDSIAGRVVLGSRKAGPLGASMFNWDSSEPQIEIGALLRQRVQNGSAGGHARNRSLPPVDAAPPEMPTMESFGGWEAANASMPSTPSAIAQSPEFAAQIQARAGSALRPPPPDSPAEMPRSPWDNDEQDERATSMELVPPPPVPPTTDAVAEGSAEAEPEPEEVDDDDDDWGEMVSSPTVDSSTTFAPLSAPPAEPKPTPLQDSFGAGFSSLDFFEPDASAPKTARANPPPPIRTSGIEPIWTPTMNSPALEPIRASLDTARTQLAMGTPIVAGTPVVEVARSSMSSNRMSMEKVWTPVISTPTTENRLSVESAWTTVAAAPVPSAKTTKQPTSKRVSFEDTCTVDENAVIDEALRSLPDLSYMLR